MNEFGQVIMITPEEGSFEEGIKASMRQIITAYGIPDDKITESILTKLAREEADKIQRRTKRGGIPCDLRILLNLRKKKQVIAWIKKIVISNGHISNLILNCNKMGFTHRRKHKEFIPDVTNYPIDEDQISFIGEKGEVHLREKEKVLRQLKERYLGRKFISAHLFEKGDEWHLFYFDHNDIYVPARPNHHFRGPHVHYISHLWGRNLDREFLWEQFENRKIKINSEHIRFIEERIQEPKIAKGKVRLTNIKPQDFMKIDDKTAAFKEGHESKFMIYRNTGRRSSE